MKQVCYLLGIFLLLTNPLIAQQRHIKGIVRDENGNALAGASVIVMGTTNGTTTDGNGNFTLMVKNIDTILKASYIGFLDKDISIEGKNSINITLAPSAVGLNEVVAIGYGVQKKVNLTGSVSTVSGQDIAKRPVMRASEALEGLSSGVTVQQTSGQPGADGGNISIRGIGTLGDASPLVLIDGIEGSLDQVDPNDIKSISILKDAASAAIYGSRAANGVILVTTKQGNYDQSLMVNYNAYFGWQKFTDLPQFTDGYSYMKALNQAYINAGETPLYSDAYLQAYKQDYKTDPDLYPNVDWQKEVYTGSGFLQHHFLSVSGGNKMIRIMGSMSYQDQKGVVPKYEAKQFAFRLNSEMNVLKNLQFRLNFVGSHSPTFSPDATGDARIIYRVNHTPPVYPAILSNGQFGVGWSGTNPLAFAKEGGTDESDFEFLQATIQANYQPISGLDIEFNYSPQYNDTWTKNFAKALNTYNPGVSTPAFTIPSKSSLSESDSRTWQNTLHLIVRFKKSFGENNLNFLVGYEQIGYNNNNFGAFRDTYPLTAFQELNAGSTANWQNNGTGSEWALQSYFGRFNYNFSGKYLFEADLRRDGSSRFATGNKFGTFPSFSLGWIISEENFMRNINWISNLKLRASWGQLGNQQIGTYPFVSVINLGTNYVLGGSVANGAAQTAMANENISWETTTDKDAGVDIGLFQGRLSLSYDYYIRNTTGILLQLPVPAIMGLAAPYQNAGVVKNTGWDFEANYSDNIGKLNFTIGLNLSNVNNKVMNLRGTGPYISTYTIVQVGDPIDALYGYKAIGLFQSQQEIGKSPTQAGLIGPGDIKYKDLNSDGVINASDREVLGNQIPQYTYGANITINYKGFDFYTLIQGVGKRSVLLDNDAVWAFYNSGPIQKWQMDYWTPNNPNAKYPRVLAETSGNNFLPSSWWVYNATFLRLKNLQIGYSLPKSWLSHSPFSKIRVYVDGDNLLTFDHMPKGWDPERPSGDATYYPISSTYTFGAQITF